MQDDLARYSCQIALPGFGTGGQSRLQAAKVLIIGAGGLGCPAALYLASAGIGLLGLADGDVVSVSNLHRQVLYTEQDAGHKKVTVAADKIKLQNPHIQVRAHDVMIGAHNVLAVIEPYDVVVDATDNFATRYLINDACVLTGKPIVYGAIYQFEGQVAFWNVPRADGTRSPNYRDVFPHVNAAMVPDCSVGGVTPPIAGIIGCMQANEVIKYFTGTGELLAGRLLMLDAATLQSRVIRLGEVSKITITRLPEEEPVPTISATEFKNASADRYLLVDVRTAGEREAFSIGGIHVPVAQLDLETGYLNDPRPVLFYCTTGKRSGEAVRQISKKFPERKLFSLEGGTRAWQQVEKER